MTNNSTRLCGGEAPASTSDSLQPAVATPPRRINFPLPRELRDQIYGYLLHHEYTEHSTCPEHGTQDARLPCSYKFHTNILAVNRQIRKEATEVLRSNDFVRVTTNWSLDEDLKVPLVCDLAHRNHHFEHLRIEYKLHVKSLTISHDQERKLVVVRFGLIKLCRFLQLYLLTCPSFVPVVVYGTGSKDNRRRQVQIPLDKFSKYDSLIIYHGRVDKPLPESTKRHLLKPFQNLIIGGQSMEINMMLPEHEVASFKLFVAPPVTNTLPMTWRLFELAREMKAAADQRVSFFPEFDMESAKVQLGSGRLMAIKWLKMLYRVAVRQVPGLNASIKHNFEQKEDFRAIMALIKEERVADYFEHDVNYLISLVREKDGPAAFPVVDKNKLSPLQLPPLIFNFPLPDGWSKPVDWSGFLDEEIYQEMLSQGLVSAPQR
ncbi:hypothetical protein KC356_g2721 [Hortaea werneckii]|nr:hypothetical protein KC356_g2721 [Hortaea werneckii]